MWHSAFTRVRFSLFIHTVCTEFEYFTTVRVIVSGLTFTTVCELF